MHWLREITKAQLSQAKTFFITSFYKKNEKRGGKDKFWQVCASLGKFGQVRIRQQIRKMKKKAERIRKENRNLSG